MFEDIRPYDDAQAVAALHRVAQEPVTARISAYLFPDREQGALAALLRDIRGVDDFQHRVMSPAVEAILTRTTDGLSISGEENMRLLAGRRFVLLANHRDIVLDSAILEYVLERNGIPCTEIAAGNNLITLPFVRDLMRSNRMVTVIRDSSSHDRFRVSMEFSQYIRSLVTSSGGNSIWLAHRGGRAKNGEDLTEPGLLKMLDLSGEGSFEDNCAALPIMPVCISYEYEPCAMLKARETVLTQREGGYHKAPMEDMQSVVTGIVQPKGRVHLAFGEPISAEEIAEAAACSRNERYRFLASRIDAHLLDLYHVWPTAEAAYCLAEGVSDSDTAAFEAYLEHEVSRAPMALEGGPQLSDEDLTAIRSAMIRLYAAPILRRS